MQETNPSRPARAEAGKKILLNQLEKYLNPYFFFVLNVAIIIVAETAGGGKLLYSTGAIHIIAIIFVVLAFCRIYFRHKIYDPILEKFIRSILAAMIVFGLSHVLEFLSMMVLGNYTDGVYANTANMYIVSLLLVALGADAFLHIEKRESRALLWTLTILITALCAWIVLLLYNSHAVDLDTDSKAPFVYLGAMVFATALGLYKAHQIKRRVPMTANFVNYLFVAILLIGLAVLPNIFYEFIVDKFQVAEYQVIYLSHFSFYAALSILFLAFGKFRYLGGLLGEVAEKMESDPNKIILQ